MSKVYNNNLIKSIIATILVVVFTVMIILIPFNTVYAAEDNGVVVTDTDISYNGFTIPRLLNTSDPVFDSYYSMQTETSCNFYCYFYLPSLNFVVFYCYGSYPSETGKILSFDTKSSAKVDTHANSTTGSYSYSKYVYDLNNHVFYNHCNYSKNYISLSVPSSNRNYSWWGYYTSSDRSSYVAFNDPFFDGSLLNFTEAVVLYANYDINGWYEYDDSSYELPNQVLSYQYLFYRENVGYVFIDSAEKLSDYVTSLTNVDNNGSFTSSLYIRWEDYFNKFIYYSYDGFSWTFLNSGDVYGTSYSTSNSVVRSVLGIPSNSSVWSYFQDNNIPEDLVMTEFTSGDPIGQTIEFDSGSGEYTSGSGISDIIDGYTVPDSHSSGIYFVNSNYYPDPPAVVDRVVNLRELYCNYPDSSSCLADLFLYDKVYRYYFTDDQQNSYEFLSFHPILSGTIDIRWNMVYSAFLDNAYVNTVYWHYDLTLNYESSQTLSTPVAFFDVLLKSLNGINNNILNFDSNVQTGFTNLTSQVRSLFDSSELGNTYLFDIKKALSDLAAAGGPDLTGVEDKLNQIISGLGSGSFELLPVDDPDSPLYSLYDNVQDFSTLNDTQNLGILSLLTSINDSVGDISDQLDDGNLASIASFIASFGLNTSALAAIITDLYTVGASLHSGMELFSGTVSKLFDTMPTSFRLLVVIGPSFALCTAMMYGARKMYG